LAKKYEISGVNLPSSFDKNIDTFASFLLSYNKTHNITGAKERGSVHENVYDSIYPLQFLQTSPKSAIDIGSGAGFPALILALAMPECDFTLYEPIAKKSSFLHMIKSEMSLSNVQIRTKRVEQDTPKVVELITSRAVGDTSLMIKLSKGFYDKNTVMILYKGSRAQEESRTLKNVSLFSREQRKYLFIKDLEDVS
jgi:16S rRNA (guanine527-N7)-methyltransferase